MNFWHLVAGLAVGLIPSQLRSARSVWDMPREELWFVVGVVISYWILAGVLQYMARRSGRVGWFRAVAVLVVMFALHVLGLVLLDTFYSRSILMGALALALFFVVLARWLQPQLHWIIGATMLAGIGLMQWAGSRPAEIANRALGLTPKPHVARSAHASQLLPLKLTAFKHYFDVCPADLTACKAPPTGGGLSTLGDGYLLANGDGTLHSFNASKADSSLKVKTLAHRIPINHRVYEAEVGPNVKNTFRVTDILVVESGNRMRLYAAHHHWNEQARCGVLRVSSIESERVAFLAATTGGEWTTVFETSPCLPATGGHLTRGSESGGRLAVYSPGTLLLTVGDHEYDGVNRSPIAAQDPASSYGKTLLIDVATGKATLFTSGHRNPQGLFIDDDGTVWSTEHGPQGGDELNILRRGANYGWPLVTLGTQYGQFDWALNPTPGRHDDYQAPVFAWTPSIAISNLVRVKGDGFKRWAGDLLVASYTRALYRLRLDGDRVMAVESIPIPGRIRDVLQNAKGDVVVYLDAGTVIIIGPGDVSAGTSVAPVGQAQPDSLRGESLFTACAGCHRVENGNVHGIGPDLGGLFRRPIASAQGFAYSPALQAHRGSWDDGTLDAFLADPQKFAPGTSMAFAGWPERGDRAALIAYLRQAAK